MPDLKEISLVLCDHQWNTSQDWASMLGRLADLSDEEIDGLERLSRPLVRLVSR